MHKVCFYIIKYLLSLILFLSNCFLPNQSIAKPKHDFYLSICEIIYKKESQLLEITFRFFTDDLEKTIFNYDSTRISPGLGKKSNGSTKSLFRYLKDHFAIYDKKKHRLNYNFIGWEIEEGLSWCYAEAKHKQFSKLKVENKLLTELFVRQKNLVYLKVGNKETSVLLDKSKITGVLVLE